MGKTREQVLPIIKHIVIDGGRESLDVLKEWVKDDAFDDPDVPLGLVCCLYTAVGHPPIRY